MQIKIGSIIRELRRREGRTQDDLATALGVTCQAVSRWESGAGYPDMEIVPSIANYFGVSIDLLFGYDNEREKRIDELAEQIMSMNRENNGENVNIDECILLARGAVTEFPSNERLMLCLADVLYNAGYVKHGECHLTDSEGYDIYDVERHRTYTEWAEATVIYEKVIPCLRHEPERGRAVKNLLQLYLNVGEYAKADALVDTMPSIHSSREILKVSALDGKERASRCSETVLTLISTAAELLADAVAANYYNIGGETAETYVKNAVGLFDLICIDGEYGQYGRNIALLKLYLSSLQWRNGKQDNAIESLYESLELAEKCEEISLDADIAYDSPLLKNEKLNPEGKEFTGFASQLSEYWPWICILDSSDVLREMKTDERYKAWLDKTKHK